MIFGSVKDFCRKDVWPEPYIRGVPIVTVDVDVFMPNKYDFSNLKPAGFTSNCGSDAIVRIYQVSRFGAESIIIAAKVMKMSLL